MTAITTVAELDALPVGARVTDTDRDEWFKKPSGLWSLTSHISQDALGILPDYLLGTYGPLTTEDVPSSLAMSKCVADDCQSSHALPPGSSYACPLHADHITAGGSR